MADNIIINFDDLKNGYCSIFGAEFNIHSLVETFSSNAIIIFQMYYFSHLSYIQEKYYGFFLGYIIYKLVRILTSYYQNFYIQKIKKFHMNSKYISMDIAYKKCMIISIVIQVLTFFPLKWLFMYIFSKVYLIKQNPNFIPYTTNKVGLYITIHFWAALFSCITNCLNSILSMFDYRIIITCFNILKLLINVLYSIYYTVTYGEEYFVRGLSYADVYGELVIMIFAIIVVKVVSPLSHNYLYFNYELLKMSLSSICEIFNMYEFFIYIFLHMYDELFIVLYAYNFIEFNDVTWYNFFFICFIFKNMIFKIERDDQTTFYLFKQKIVNNQYKNLQNSQSEAHNDKKVDINFLKWKLFIKYKIRNIIFLNSIYAAIYIIFYHLDGFSIVSIEKKNILAILILGIQGIAEQLGLFSKNVYMCLFPNFKGTTFLSILVFLTISISLFYFVHYANGSIEGILLVIYFTYYGLFIKMYSTVISAKEIDELYENKGKNKKNYSDDYKQNSSSDRIDLNLVK